LTSTANFLRKESDDKMAALYFAQLPQTPARLTCSSDIGRKLREIMVTNRPSYEQFAALMAESIKPDGLSGSLKYDSDAFALVESDEQGKPMQRMLLGHYFAEYCSLDSSERPQLLSKVRSLYGESAFPANFEDAGLRLMPHLIDRWSVFRTNMNLALGMAKELDDPNVDVTPDFAPFVVIADAFAMVLALDLDWSSNLRWKAITS